jgi:hypothetical protein
VDDGWLSENWNQLVEELIPLGIAQLCFFDAEKIRFLAEDETSMQALGDAIKSLLGLDLAERSVAVVAVLEGRIAKVVQAPSCLLSWTGLFLNSEQEGSNDRAGSRSGAVCPTRDSQWAFPGP